MIAAILREAARGSGCGRTAVRDAAPSRRRASRIWRFRGLSYPRIGRFSGARGQSVAPAYGTLSPPERVWLAAVGLPRLPARHGRRTRAAQDAAFDNIGRTIVLSRDRGTGHPKNALRTDEIVWGRAPARLDLGGGWTDTPPYSLEHGGCVINAAVDLNGQPPIQVYARVIPEPEIRINSIDHGSRLAIRSLDELLDYRNATEPIRAGQGRPGPGRASRRDAADGRPGAHPARRCCERFGGGIELTTLAAIPSGSGLGTSSIMGAVLAAVVHRMIGDGL